jgi:hypothetical protein
VVAERCTFGYFDLNSGEMWLDSRRVQFRPWYNRINTEDCLFLIRLIQKAVIIIFFFLLNNLDSKFGAYFVFNPNSFWVLTKTWLRKRVEQETSHPLGTLITGLVVVW